MIPRHVTLRPARPEDEEFLFRVYASTRTEELAQAPWSEEEKTAFLQMQARAQHQHYHTFYAEAAYQVILLKDCPIGRIYIDRAEDEILMMDIALLPDYRCAGIGTALIRDLMAEAARDGKPVRIHVETFNPALRLYRRLGFTTISEDGIYLYMEWVPDKP